MGVFFTLIGALFLGFLPKEAASIAIIGGADGPTSIFLTAKLAPHLIGPIAIAAYSYMALIPVIQPPIMRLLTSRDERLIHMEDLREVSRTEKLIFPILGVLLCCLLAPTALPLLGMLFFGNLMKECGVVDRLAQTARTAVIDTATIFLGFCVGLSTQADVFLTPKSLLIFFLGAVAFSLATGSGIIFAKIMNLFLKKKINPLLGAAGVSAVPGSAREVHLMGQHEDP
jgi:sodium ion-translocating decarboxylase beta subunit